MCGWKTFRFNETRNYVQRILWHTVVYGWLRSQGQPQNTASWLAPIRATNAAQAQIDRN